LTTEKPGIQQTTLIYQTPTPAAAPTVYQG
jgi:hypothetical protein